MAQTGLFRGEKWIEREKESRKRERGGLYGAAGWESGAAYRLRLLL